MSDRADVSIEEGQFGRLLTVRVRPNIDLVEGIEQVCADHQIGHAEVRGAIGSLTDAVLITGDVKASITGPGLEIALASGRIAPNADGRPQARLFGLVSDSAGHPHGGEFVRGENPVFVTLELVLQEWIPSAKRRSTKGDNDE